MSNQNKNRQNKLVQPVKPVQQVQPVKPVQQVNLIDSDSNESNVDRPSQTKPVTPVQRVDEDAVEQQDDNIVNDEDMHDNITLDLADAEDIHAEADDESKSISTPKSSSSKLAKLPAKKTTYRKKSDDESPERTVSPIQRSSKKKSNRKSKSTVKPSKHTKSSKQDLNSGNESSDDDYKPSTKTAQPTKKSVSPTKPAAKPAAKSSRSAKPIPHTEPSDSPSESSDDDDDDDDDDASDSGESLNERFAKLKTSASKPKKSQVNNRIQELGALYESINKKLHEAKDLLDQSLTEFKPNKEDYEYASKQISNTKRSKGYENRSEAATKCLRHAEANIAKCIDQLRIWHNNCRDLLLLKSIMFYQEKIYYHT